jgi:hypothetical protein
MAIRARALARGRWCGSRLRSAFRRCIARLFLGLAARFFLGSRGFGGAAACLVGSAHARVLFLAAAIGVGTRLAVRFALELRFGELAQRVLALGVDRLVFLDGAALDVGALLAHFDVDRLRSRAALARRNGDFADGAALERDLFGRGSRSRHGRLFLLAVRAAQEAEQLHLLGAADDLIGVGEFHSGLAELREQPVHRRAEHLGQLFDGDVRHRLSTPWPVRTCCLSCPGGISH